MSDIILVIIHERNCTISLTWSLRASSSVLFTPPVNSVSGCQEPWLPKRCHCCRVAAVHRWLPLWSFHDSFVEASTAGRPSVKRCMPLQLCHREGRGGGFK